MFAISSPIISVSNNLFKNQWDYQDFIDASKDIMIAFGPKNYKPFLICGDKHFYPSFSFQACKLKKVDSSKLNAEVVIRIKGIEPQRHRQLSLYLQIVAEKRALSSHSGILNTLSAGAGLHLNFDKHAPLNPSDLFKAMLGNRLTDASGNHFEIEVYTLKDKPLNQILSDIEFFESKMRFGYVLSDLFYSYLKRYRKNLILSA